MSEFKSHWVSHSYGLVPHLSKNLSKLQLDFKFDQFLCFVLIIAYDWYTLRWLIKPVRKKLSLPQTEYCWSFFTTRMFIYIYIYIVNIYSMAYHMPRVTIMPSWQPLPRAIIAKGNLKAPFSIATPLRCGESTTPFLGLLHFILDSYLIAEC